MNVFAYVFVRVRGFITLLSFLGCCGVSAAAEYTRFLCLVSKILKIAMIPSKGGHYSPLNTPTPQPVWPDMASISSSVEILNEEGLLEGSSMGEDLDPDEIDNFLAK